MVVPHISLQMASQMVLAQVRDLKPLCNILNARLHDFLYSVDVGSKNFQNTWQGLGGEAVLIKEKSQTNRLSNCNI